MEEKIKEFRKKYGLSKRQTYGLRHLLLKYKIPYEAALIELKIREDFKDRREIKLEKLFGKRESCTFTDRPKIILEDKTKKK